jgi:hypothetical protein
MRLENTRTLQEPGSTMIIKEKDHYTELSTMSLNEEK